MLLHGFYCVEARKTVKGARILLLRPDGVEVGVKRKLWSVVREWPAEIAEEVGFEVIISAGTEADARQLYADCGEATIV